MRGCWSPVRSAIERMLAASKPLSANSDNAARKIDRRVARERLCSARFLVREAPPTLWLLRRMVSRPALRSFAFERHGRRLDIGVESLCSVGKAALRIGAIV